MGRLEMWIGPMFSGKTSMLLDKIAQHCEQVFVITHMSDTRYKINTIVSHDKKTYPASLTCDELMIPSIILEASKYKYIAIEEGQFFKDIVAFVTLLVEKFDRTVYVAGLDGDFQRQPFRNILDLVPFADTVVRLTSLCHKCGCPAPFSTRTTTCNDTILIGGAETYSPACRIHFRN